MKQIIPMLASSIDEEKLAKLWGDNNWIVEEKLDGSRYILQFDLKGVPLLTSRRVSVKSGKLVDKTENLRGYVVNDYLELANTILDGEIVGGHNFGDTVSLMGSSAKRAQELLSSGMKVCYNLFDVIEYKGNDVRKFNQEERGAILSTIIKRINNPYWKLVERLPNKKSSFDKIVKAGGEGVILKCLKGIYEEGDRSKYWIKVKKKETYDGVIMGAIEGTGKYKGTLGSLIIGQYMSKVQPSILREVATISGMDDTQRNDFWKNIRIHKGKVVEFEAQSATKSRYRHPQFLRLRNDKNPKDCIF